MSTVLANPAEMIERGAPHLIHNDEELAVYTDALFKLTAKEHPTEAEIEAMELLGVLIEKYEDEHYPIPDSDPTDLVRFLLEQNGLQQRDLVPIFGTESAVSMFLNGKRNLTVEQIRALGMRFHLDPGVFIKANTAANAA
jgi:HTH-type transcriptional regulator / antitoxin HigA